MAFYERYVKGDFTSYEDFMENFSIKVPKCFNFAYDVVDEIAAMDPRRLAMIWTNEAGEERNFTFADMKEQSSRVANYLRSLGINIRVTFNNTRILAHGFINKVILRPHTVS